MGNSKFFLGNINIKGLKLGNSDVKAYLGDTLLYPLSKSIEDAVVTCASATYNGSNQTAQSITVTLSGVTLVEDTDYTVTQNTGGTNAGTYPVVVTGMGNYEGTASGTFTIDKVTPTVTAPTVVTGLVYNASSQALVNAGSTNFGTLKYSLDDSTYTTSIPSGTNATSYTIYYRVDGNSNVNDVAASSIANSIAKVTPTVVAPTAKVLTYNGSAQELVNAGSTNYGTLKYSLNDSTYTTAIPTATNYGSYTVYYKVDGDSNVNSVAAQTVACSINEKQVTATVVLSQTAYTYNGSACQPTVTVKDGTTVIDPSEYTVTYTNNINAGTATVTISDNVGGNYEVIGSTTFTINKADPTYTAPTANNRTYDTTSKALLNAGAVTGGTLYYSSDNSTWSTTIPSQTNAGTYTTYWKIAGDSNHNDKSSASISTTVSAKTVSSPTITLSQDSYVYNNTARQPSATVKDGTVTIASSEYTVSYSNNTNVGTATCTITDKTGGNYTVSGSKTFTITCASCTAPTAKSLTYNGSAQALVNAGSTSYGTMVYSIDNSSWSTSVPSGTNATSYTVYWKVTGNTNVCCTASSSVACSIAKAAMTYTAPSATTYTYANTARALVSGGSANGGSIQYSTSQTGTYTTTVPTQTNAGTYTTWWKAVPDSNHSGGTNAASISTTISKANISPTVSISNWTYGGTASNPSVTGNSGSGTVTYYYKLSTASSWSTTKPSAAGSYNIRADIAATTNYNSGTCTNNFTINKANISPTVSISNWTYGGTASNPSVAGNSGSGTVTYYYKLSTASSWSTTKPSDAGSYNIRADIAATSNYNSGSCTNNFTISKAASSLSFNVSRLSVGVGEIKTNVVTVNAGDGTVTYNSNNTTAVTVNNSGVVTGVNYGGATITATISSTNNYISASTSYTVTCAAFFTTTYDIIDTTNPTRIGSAMTNLVEVEFDDGISYTKYALRTGHTFSTTGEHTVKYYLADPTFIGTSALTKCDRLTSVNIPDNITTISGYAFQGCSSLTSVVIPDSVTKIADYSVFDYCTSLTSVTIGSGITSIGTWAFSYCTSLTSITINATAPPTLSSDTFRNTNNCPIYVPTCSLVSTYKGRSGWSNYSSRICALDCYYITTKFNVTTTSSPTIIANATTSFNLIEIDGTPMCIMSAYTFSTTGEHTIKYYLNKTNIGNNAFQGCSSLTSVTIPEDVTSIGFQAFCNCSGLTSCTIGSGVTSIEDRAFYRCSGLTSIDIPDSVTSIGASAFTSCSGLTSCIIGSGVTSINQQTFYNCNSLTSIDIPDSVTSIGNSAFTYCSGLTSIDIPNSVTSIGGSAFRDCSGLTSCTIGNGVTSIGDMSFQNCTSLTSITSNRTTAPTITNYTFRNVKTNGTLTVPQGSSGYDVWMGTSGYYLGYYNWTKVEQ